MDQCGGLNESGLCRLIYVNAWSPVGGTWVGLSGVALEEGVCHFGAPKVHAMPIVSLSLSPTWGSR